MSRGVPTIAGRMRRGNQLTRQWRLLQLIDRPAGVAVDDAALELGCAVRTIWRDLRVLEQAGFPIYDDSEPDGRRSIWRLEEHFRLRLPLKLSLGELTALLMSRDLVMPVAVGLGPSVASAFEKLGSVLSKDALALLDRIRDTIGVRASGAKLQAPAAEHLADIQRALLERRRLQLRYYSMSRDEITDRRVDPYHLTLFQGGFYVVGYCHLRDSVCIFAVERIRALDVLVVRFEKPTDFDVERFLAGAWGIIQGEIVTVRVVFSRALARYIKDRLWHPTQQFRELEGGRLEMAIRVSDTFEVRRWILGFGAEAEVLQPASLREALRADAEAVVRALVPQRRPLAEISASGTGPPSVGKRATRT